MAWGSEWKVPPISKKTEKEWLAEYEQTPIKDTELKASNWKDWGKPVVGWDVGKEDKSVAVIMKDDKILEFKEGEEAKQLIEQTIIYPATPEFPAVKYDHMVTVDLVQNKHPTHDPYTNPNAFLYYQCECGKRLDPHVKSFAALNNAAMNSNWKIRWGNDSYVPYCPKCVEEKGIEE